MKKLTSNATVVCNFSHAQFVFEIHWLDYCTIVWSIVLLLCAWRLILVLLRLHRKFNVLLSSLLIPFQKIIADSLLTVCGCCCCCCCVNCCRKSCCCCCCIWDWACCWACCICICCCCCCKCCNCDWLCGLLEQCDDELLSGDCTDEPVLVRGCNWAPCFCCVACRIACMCVGEVGKHGRFFAGDGESKFIENKI